MTPKVDEPSEPTFPRVGSRGDVGAEVCATAASGVGLPGRAAWLSHVTDRGGADEFGLVIRLLPSQVVVGVIGEVDMATAPDLGCLLGALVERGHTDVVLDLANLDFLDSSGLHAIEDTAARLRPAGGVLRIRSPGARTRWLLDVSEVSRLVEFEPSDPDLVPLGSEQPAGDNTTIVTAASAEATVDVGWATAMPDGHDVVDAAALWRSVLPTVAEISRARRRLHAKAVFIVAIVVASYWAAVISAWSAAIRIGSAGVLAMGLIAVATGIMHDANHGAFSRHRWLNRLVSYVADILGTSSWLWRFKHNVLHHAATNIEGVDTDLAQAPFARLSPGQPWHSWHRYQHVYLWPLYGFMGLKNLIIGDLGNLATSRIGPQALRTRPSRNDLLHIAAGKLAHLGLFVVVPVLYNPWWAVLVFYLCISWVVGFVLAVTFQLAHCVEGMLFTDESSPHRGKDFVAHQLATTTNVASPLPAIGHVFRWLVGGLDHQIEHHLGTRLPHTALAAVGGRFRLLCIDLGVDYHEHAGLWTGLRSHGRWLKRMGQPPSTASPQPVQLGCI